MKSKIFIIFTAAMCFTLSLGNVSAKEGTYQPEDSDSLIIKNSEEINKQNEEENQKKAIVDFEKKNNINTRALVSKTSLVNRTVKYNVPIGWAGGQLTNGTKFNGPGSICWVDGGNNKDVSLSVGYGPVSFSISAGNISKASTSYCKDLVPSQYYSNVKLYINKDIEVLTYAYYTKEAMAPESAWTFQGYIYGKNEVGNSLYIYSV